MRKVDAAGAGSAASAPRSRDRASRELVCLALILAAAVLLLRIASML
jgi:hypothetical protein